MKVAIVDDLQADKEILEQYINRYAAEKSLFIEIECFCSGEHFLKNAAPNKYRLIFLDIYMKGLDGMQVAEALRRDDKESLLVFTTSSKDFAIQGYAVKASGYLVKPYDYEMFPVMEQWNLSGAGRKDLGIHEVKKRSHDQLLHDILYCDYDNHYILFHTKDEVIRSYMKFKELEELLAPYDEFLCATHRTWRTSGQGTSAGECNVYHEMGTVHCHEADAFNYVKFMPSLSFEK